MPDWMQRTRALGEVCDEVAILEQNLQTILDAKNPESKWKWPAEAKAVLKQMRELSKNRNSLLRRYLDPLLVWPDNESVDPKGFYGKDAPFDRKEDWFESVVGFNKYETCYTFTDRWDKLEMMTTILVPNDLESGDQCPVIWYFHGGGFVSVLQ